MHDTIRGNTKRKKKAQRDKFGKVMHEWKHGSLRSGSGKKVTDIQQAKAIAAHESGIDKD